MLIDDSPSIRKMMRLMLLEAGYAILAVESGPQALIRLAQEPVDLICLDFIMPCMSGIDFLRILQALPATAVIPVLMVTTESDRRWRQLGAQLGCRGWLVKPFKKEQLLRVVQHILDSP